MRELEFVCSSKKSSAKDISLDLAPSGSIPMELALSE
jgi:hypothetical protein